MGGHFTETIRHVSRSGSQLPIPGPEVSSGARAPRFPPLSLDLTCWQRGTRVTLSFSCLRPRPSRSKQAETGTRAPASLPPFVMLSPTLWTPSGDSEGEEVQGAVQDQHQDRPPLPHPPEAGPMVDGGPMGCRHRSRGRGRGGGARSLHRVKRCRGLFLGWGGPFS